MILRDLMRVLGSSGRAGRNLTYDEAYRAFDSILSGLESDIRTGAFLICMRIKGASVEELTAFARAARARATIPCMGMPGVVFVSAPHDGLDRIPPLEVAAGLASAAAGSRVVIVSDRCVPPKRGLTAASVLEELNIHMTFNPREAEQWVEQTGFCVTAAAGMLPALLALRKVRGEVGLRTPLSTVEKLLAPSTAALVIGAEAGPVLGQAVEVLQNLGHPGAIAIQGVEGGVVPSVTRRSRGIELTKTHQVPLSVRAEDFGLACANEPELPLYAPAEEGSGTGDIQELRTASSRSVLSVIAGETGPARNATLLTAALMLKAVGRAPTLADGVSLAAEAIDSGAAHGVLRRLRDLSKG